MDPFDTNMELPPKVFFDMGGEFIEFVATIVAKTTAYIKQQPNVMNEKGKLTAIGVANCSIIRDAQ